MIEFELNSIESGYYMNWKLDTDKFSFEWYLLNEHRIILRIHNRTLYYSCTLSFGDNNINRVSFKDLIPKNTTYATINDFPEKLITLLERENFIDVEYLKSDSDKEIRVLLKSHILLSIL